MKHYGIGHIEQGVLDFIVRHLLVGSKFAAVTLHTSMKYNIALLVLLSSAIHLDAQDPVSQPHQGDQGDLYFYFGWNRSAYSASDIHFRGTDHDFVLKDVLGDDRPSEFDFDVYFSPVKFTIPQYNFRVGYFLDDHWDISLGTDHMKYVVRYGQVVDLDGTIDLEGSEFEGVYDNEPVTLSPDFLQFEHTDGLNYVNVALRHSDDLWAYRWIDVDHTQGIGIGALVPKTNATLLGQQRNDRFHLAGCGVDITGGLRLGFFDLFFVQSEIKGGFINMPDIRTTPSKSDRASQAFFFGQWNILFGTVVHLK